MSDGSASAGGPEVSERPATPKRRFIIAGSVVVLVPVALFLVATLVSAGTVPRGTSVEGISIGGLSADEAKAVLTTELVPRSTRPLVVVADGSRVAVTPRTAGVSIDVAGTVDQVTSGGGPFTAIAGLFGGSRELDPVLFVDDAKLDSSAVAVVAKLDRAAVEGGIDFVGAKAVPITPVPGRRIEAPIARAAILASVGAADRQVPLDVVARPTELTAADVDQAVATLGRTVVSGPVAVRVTGTSDGQRIDESVSVPIRRLSPYLSTTVEEGRIELAVDAAGVMKELKPDLGPLEVPAVDATFRIAGDKPVVVPSRDGSSVGKSALGSAIIDAATSTGARVASVRLTSQPAELTTAEARGLGVVEELSSFRQPFPFAPYRKQNIGQAAKRINGSLLLPGQTFSLNDTVLERTPANGYTTGFVIKGGRLAEDLGGGVSTSATAMWHAAFFAGLERVEQRAHSFYIARYRAGLEATVAWGSLDLRFTNDSPNGVFITSQSGSNFITVTMYGTKRYDVTAEAGPRTNPKPFRTLTDTSATCTPQSGVNGFRIVVTRVFKVNGKEVKREPLTTRYNPANDVTCKKPVRPSSTPTPRPTPNPAAPPRPGG